MTQQHQFKVGQRYKITSLSNPFYNEGEKIAIGSVVKVHDLQDRGGQILNNRNVTQSFLFADALEYMSLVEEDYNKRFRACLTKWHKRTSRTFVIGDKVIYNGAKEEGRQYERPDVGTLLKIVRIGLDAWPECVSHTGKKYGFPPHVLNHA